jgi:hypothetical protein
MVAAMGSGVAVGGAGVPLGTGEAAGVLGAQAAVSSVNARSKATKQSPCFRLQWGLEGIGWIIPKRPGGGLPPCHDAY